MLDAGQAALAVEEVVVAANYALDVGLLFQELTLVGVLVRLRSVAGRAGNVRLMILVIEGLVVLDHRVGRGGHPGLNLVDSGFRSPVLVEIAGIVASLLLCLI